MSWFSPPKLDDRSRRGAVAIITALAVFASVQLITGVYMHPGQRRDPGYSSRLERHVRQISAATSEPVTVVVLGSSRTHEGLRANELNAPLSAALARPVVVTNFGMAGAGPLSELLTWQRLREDGVRPTCVVIEVLPAFLSAADAMNDLGEARMPVNRLRRSDLSLLEQYVGEERKDLRHEWRMERPNPLYAHRLTILSRISPGLVPIAFRSEANLPLPEDLPPTAIGVDNWTPVLRPAAVAHASTEYAAVLKRFRLGGRNCIAIRDLLERCKRDGVPAVLLVMPEGPVFRSWYPPDVYPQIRQWLEGLSTEFGVTLIDAREWMATEEDFKDSHHLTPAGAARFTQRLGTEMLVPFLQKQVASQRSASGVAQSGK